MVIIGVNMYCPLCKAEYKPEIKVCADCKVTLIDSLPEIPELEEINWVELGKFDGKVHAEMVEEILDNNNIAHFFKADFLTTTFGITGVGAIGGTARLYVPEDDYETARQLMGDIIE